MHIFGRKFDREPAGFKDAAFNDEDSPKHSNSKSGDFDPNRAPIPQTHSPQRPALNDLEVLETPNPLTSKSVSPAALDPSVRAEDAEDPVSPPTVSSEIEKAHHYAKTLQNDIRESVERHQQSVARTQALATVLEQIELKLAAYERMESRLIVADQSNARLTREVQQKTKRSEDLQMRLSNLEQNAAETRRQLDSAQSDLAVQNDFMRAQKDRLSKLKQLLIDAGSKLSESDARHTHLSSVHKRLQDEFQSQNIESSKKSRQIIELQKSYETVTLKLAARTKDLEVMQVELNAIKSEYVDVKERFFDTHTQLENTRYDFRAQKGVLENQLKRREEDTLALKSQLDNVSSQARVAGNMTSHREREIVDLQNTLEAERDRLQLTETRLAEKSQESTINARALERLKLEFEILTEKHAHALSDVEMLRSMTLTQNDKLSRFAAIAGSPDPKMGPRAAVAPRLQAPLVAPDLQDQRAREKTQAKPDIEPLSGGFDPQLRPKAVYGAWEPHS